MAVVFPGEEDAEYYREHPGPYRRSMYYDDDGQSEDAKPASRRKTVLITGASRGIGYRFVEVFLLARWNIIPTARRPENLAVLPALLEPFRIPMYPLDVGDGGSIDQLAAELKGERIDLVINNAGVLTPKEQGLEITDFAAWEESFRVNTIGPFRLARALLPNLELGVRPVIANISSEMGSIAGNQSGGYYAYRSSKAALNMVTKSLAEDLKPRGIIVVSLHPGWVRTHMGGKEAPMTPNESVRGMEDVLRELTMEDTGSFIRYDGTRLPW